MADQSTGANPDVLLNIHVALARIEEKQEAGTRAADHRHANVMMAIAQFVPRAEIERENRAIADRIANVGERVDGVTARVDRTENRLWAAAVGLLLAFCGIAANAFGLHLKPGG